MDDSKEWSLKLNKFDECKEIVLTFNKLKELGIPLNEIKLKKEILYEGKEWIITEIIADVGYVFIQRSIPVFFFLKNVSDLIKYSPYRNKRYYI